MEKKSIFTDNVSMDSQTVFHEDGHINVFPCGYMDSIYVVRGGKWVSQKGVMVTEDDGTCHFKPYAQNGEPRYAMRFQSSCTEIKETKNDLIISFKFHKNLKNKELLDLLKREFQVVSKWMKYRDID